MKQHFTWILAGLILCGLLGMSTLSLAQGGTWIKKANMPTARHWLSTSTVDGVIYAIGGVTGSVQPVLSTVEAYNPLTDTWTTKADMLTPRYGLSTSVVDGIIYAIGGGLDSSYLTTSTVEAYNPTTDTWTTLADMPTPRAYVSTTVVDGIIYAMGGIQEPGPRSNFEGVPAVEAYDPATNTWTALADILTPRAGLHASVVNGKIYAMGGAVDINSPGLPTVEVYDPATNTWATKADMLTPRVILATSVVEGIIYAIGGTLESSGSTWPAISTAEAYNPATDTWTALADMPTARAWIGTSVVDGIIYVIGGAERFLANGLSTVEAFTPVGVTAVSPQGKLTAIWGSIKNVR